MKVEFARDALGDRDSGRFITAIFWLFVEGRHEWCLEDPSEITDSQWYEHEARDVRVAARELATQAGRTMKTRQVRVERLGGEPNFKNGAWHIPADAAAWHLARPLLIAVENAFSDGAFLRLILTRVGFRKLRRRLGTSAFDALKSAWKASEIGDGRWLEIRHGGGGTLERQIRLIARQSAGLPPRLIVLVDSDRSGPREPLGLTAVAANQACAEEFGSLDTPWDIQPFVLKKREVENYIPVAAAKARYGNRIAAYERLSDEEKDYYDLKQIHNNYYRIILPKPEQGHLHENSIRARAGNKGQELDNLVDYVVSAL